MKKRNRSTPAKQSPTPRQMSRSELDAFDHARAEEEGMIADRPTPRPLTRGQLFSLWATRTGSRVWDAVEEGVQRVRDAVRIATESRTPVPVPNERR